MSTPVFNRSSLTYTNAQTEVAGAAGTNTTEMLSRAGNSLDAVAQKWNRLRWKFLQTEQIIGLVAPFTVTGCTTTQDSSLVTTSTVNGFTSVLADDVASGGGLRPETLVSATGATAITLYASASATVTGATLTFKRSFYPLNSDFKEIFDVRMMGQMRPLYYNPRRLYDREVIDQASPLTPPYGYELYASTSKGKIRFLPPPGGAETAWIKYYRRMIMPSLTSTDGLDVPEDYEDVFVAAAKAHFLADKGQPHREQWLFWQKYAQDGLREMRQDERIIEDEDMTLQPPIAQRIYGPNNPLYPYMGF